MFPWICFKCGHFADDAPALVKHIRDEKHTLSPDELAELTKATEEVKELLVSNS